MPDRHRGEDGRGGVSVLKRLLGHLADGPAPDPKIGVPPASPSAGSGSASASAAAGSHSAVVQALVTQVVKQSEDKLTPDAVDPDADMCDRGYLDSLTYVAFLVFVEATYGVRILDHELTVGDLRTVSAVADRIVAASKGAS